MNRGARHTLALACLTALACAQREGVHVTWKGAAYPPPGSPTPTPPGAKAIDRWTPFAEATGSRLVLSDDGRFLLVLSETFQAGKRGEHREVGVMLELVAQAAEVVDHVLDPPKEEASTVVVVGVRREHYGRLLDHLVTLDQRVEPWAGAAGRAACGFALSEPLVGAWIEDPEGVEEWQPYNELVHRTAQLLVRQRAPHVPDWLLLGLAWHVEDTVRASIYCFPHRTGFVSALSHSDWGRWLSNAFKKSRRKMQGKPPVLEAAEFAGWNPSAETEFATDAAYVSFGIARFLAQRYPEKIQELLIRWSEAVDEGRKVWVSDTEWRTDPDYRLPVGDQLAALEGIQPGFLEEATRFFRKNGASKRVSPKIGKKHW